MMLIKSKIVFLLFKLFVDAKFHSQILQVLISTSEYSGPRYNRLGANAILRHRSCAFQTVITPHRIVSIIIGIIGIIGIVSIADRAITG